MQKLFKKSWNIATTVLVLIIAVPAILLSGFKLLGFDIYTVLSGSMEPAYHVGSVIYVKEKAPEKIEVGDAITFKLNSDMAATHRVIEITEDENGELSFRTKGDANNASDGHLVNYKEVLGVPRFTIPYLGYLAEFLKTSAGRTFGVTFSLIVLAMVFVPDIIFKKDEKKK